MIDDDQPDNVRNTEYLRRYLDRKTDDEQHRDSVVHDMIDRQHMEKVLQEIDQFKAMERSFADQFGDNGAPLTSDIFHALNKAVPVLRDDDEMRPDSLIVRETIKEMMALREYEELSDYTNSDPVASALAGTTMQPKVTEIMGRLKEKQDAINEMLERLDGDESDPLTDEELQELSDALGSSLADMRSDLRDAMNEATDDLSNMEAMSRTWGTGPGELRRMPAEDRIRLAKRIRGNPNLARLAELIGAFTQYAFAMQHQKTDQLQTDIYDIELGNDLGHVLPAELALLNNPATKMDFERRYQERGLMQYKLQGRETVGKGGIVCCVDTSSSMGLERDVFAKAVALSLLRIAQNQNRTFYGIIFASRGELQSWDLTKASAETVLDFATFSFMGGTDFESPLDAAMDYLVDENDREGSLKSDIVFITDGYGPVSDEFMTKLTNFKERLGARIFGVSIGGDSTADPLKTICDGRVWPVAKLNSAEDVRDVFRAI